MNESRITLGEENTPLVGSRHIGPAAGLDQLYFKLETVNPTGSYKDRFAAAAVNDMLAEGKRRVIATSSGNTGSALAAYCAAAGLQCEIAVVATAPDGKLQQMMAYGADIYKVDGFGIDPYVTEATFQQIQQKAQAPDAQLQISAYRYSPVGMAGVETISHELVKQAKTIGRPIDHVFVCAGGGGLTLAVARGFQAARDNGALQHGVSIHCVQPVGNNTIAGPLCDGADSAQPCNCTTQISGLQVPDVLDGNEVIAACRATSGTGHLVDDPTVWELQAQLARLEGIFCEPAAAVPLAGALQAAEKGLIDRNAMVVCLVTGSGFKDQTSVDRMTATAICPTITLQELQN